MGLILLIRELIPLCPLLINYVCVFMKKIVFAVTVGQSLSFLKGYPDSCEILGYDSVLVSSPDNDFIAFQQESRFKCVPLKMERNPSFFSDLISFFLVLSLLIREKPHVVNAGTPKASFLFMIASFILRVPVRVYTIHGFRHESLFGFKRQLMIFIEKITVWCSTEVNAVSPSLLKLARIEKIVPVDKGIVLGMGSCGIDLNSFPSFRCDSVVSKSKLGFEVDDFVVVFAGRLIERKGIYNLLDAMVHLHKADPSFKLLILGDVDQTQPISSSYLELIETAGWINHCGYKSSLSDYFLVSDLFCMPSHWEGFGNVLVEAAASCLPVVTTDGTGTVDAVSDGYNGTVVPVGDVEALINAISFYRSNPDVCTTHGKNGVEWSKNFGRDKIALRFSKLISKLDFSR